MGLEDSWSGLAQHEAMAAAIPGAQLVLVENSGHMSTMEQPRAVSTALAVALGTDGPGMHLGPDSIPYQCCYIPLLGDRQDALWPLRWAGI